jgi:hypothetical protein
MNVCPRVSVLCCPVSVEALRWADPPNAEDVKINKKQQNTSHADAVYWHQLNTHIGTTTSVNSYT